MCFYESVDKSVCSAQCLRSINTQGNTKKNHKHTYCQVFPQYGARVTIKKAGSKVTDIKDKQSFRTKMYLKQFMQLWIKVDPGQPLIAGPEYNSVKMLRVEKNRQNVCRLHHDVLVKCFSPSSPS